MKRTCSKLLFLSGAVAGLAILASAQAGNFTSDFATPPAGATLYGDGADSGVIEDGVLKLTKAVGSMLGGFIIDDLDGGATIYGFTADFKLLIGAGSQADGFSFSFGPDVPDAGISEEGAGSGLSVCFDTYDNGGGEAPAIDLKKGGAIIASFKQGAIGLMRKNAFVDVHLEVKNDGSLSLSVANTAIFQNLVGAFAPTAGRFGLGARTGGSTDNHFVDDLSITTVTAAPTHPIVASASPQGADARPDAVLTVTIKDQAGATVNTGTVKVKFDGVDVVANVSKTGDTTTVTYDPPGVLASGSRHTASVACTDSTATTITFDFSFTVMTYNVALPPSAKVTPDTSKRGFIWNIFANTANQENSNARTEAALAGALVDATGAPLPNLADPMAQGVAIGTAAQPTPENAPISFVIESVINVSQEGADNAGNFQPDDVMPGIPAIDGSTDGIAAEVLTFIELPAGVTVMGVSSDDGFRTTAGAPWDAFGALRLGQYDGGRSTAETRFAFVVEEPGVYAFRTTWEEGNGGANVEWYSFKADGSRVLINDVANGGLKAYWATTTPIPAHVKSVSPGPAPRQLNGVSSTVTILLEDGSLKAVDDSSIALKIDGQAVNVTKTRAGKTVKVVYTPTGLLIPAEAHTAELTFKDTAGAAQTQQWPFRNLKNLVLPAPKIMENFDSYPQDTQPTGWRAWNFTAHNDDGRDITTQTSESYEDWVLVDVSNISSIDGARPFNITPGQFIEIAGNRVELKNGDPPGGTFPEWIMSGNVLYAESDSRNNTDSRGGPNNGQTQFIESKPFNCSTFKGVVITFSSIYEQNQDSLGSVEYSVDGGKTWLPVVYFLEEPDIKLNADGTVDAVRTFKDSNADTSSWVDNGVAKGDNYGDGIGAAIAADLGLYIVPRINDGQVEGKRVEVFRLDQAAGKADVRLRLASLGTDSWYFAIDNLAFYDIEPPTPPTPPKFNTPKLVTGGVEISWTGGGKLQQADNVTGPWSDATNQNNPQTAPTTGAARFFRLVK
jgi:hypothetical protein